MDSNRIFLIAHPYWRVARIHLPRGDCRGSTLMAQSAVDDRCHVILYRSTWRRPLTSLRVPPWRQRYAISHISTLLVCLPASVTCPAHLSSTTVRLNPTGQSTTVAEQFALSQLEHESRWPVMAKYGATNEVKKHCIGYTIIQLQTCVWGRIWRNKSINEMRWSV